MKQKQIYLLTLNYGNEHEDWKLLLSEDQIRMIHWLFDNGILAEDQYEFRCLDMDEVEEV